MMFGRPRCREWTPLATQQLRLRSLIQIVGYNIRPPEWCSTQCSFYLTLHHTTMSAPFYTSERISSPHPKWKEIDSEITQRMSSTNVILRIWCHTLQPPADENQPETCEKQETLIQTWGIYFSGLRYIGANLSLNFTSDCFKSNTLVFQMLGGYFCSYKSLKLDIIPPENEIKHGSLSSESSGKTNPSSKITIETKFLQNHRMLKESRSVSPSKFSRKSDKEYSKSQSPVEKRFNQNFPSFRSSSSLNIVQNQQRELREDSSETRTISESQQQIFEHSPDNVHVKEFTSTENNCDSLSKNASQEELFDSKIDLSETAENYDLRNESNWVPKYRYSALHFLKSEIRPGYNATKLQKLHILQYSIKKKQEAVQEIKERIYKKSALSNLDAFPSEDQYDIRQKFKSRSQRSLFSPEETEELKKVRSEMDLGVKNGRVKVDDKPVVPNGPRLTLKLNDLLSFKSKPSPFQIAEHVRLTKQIEILRFKRTILIDERDSKMANIRRLKEIYGKLCEENQDVGTELMQSYHALCKHGAQLSRARAGCAAARELAARAQRSLAARRAALLRAVADVFHISQVDEATWAICNVPLPICGDDSPRQHCGPGESVAAGLAAQATCLIAALLNQPLRYKISLLGSASKIQDLTPNLPDPNIPLFARGGDVTLFRYALFLLNKCILQLLFASSLPPTDMRRTLHNLNQLILTDTTKMFGTHKWLEDSECTRTQSLRSLVASERGKCGRQFNRFKESFDGHSPESLRTLQRNRLSRSVGSYQDDNELTNLDASTASIMGSEPNIYNAKLAAAASSTDIERKTLKSRNSDSEILKSVQSASNKVVFTLGEDTTLDNLNGEKLLRISTNNDDEIACSSCLDENVKRICSEISDFCTKSDPKGSNKEIFAKPGDGIDIAKYMEARNSIEIEEKPCESCEGKDGRCDNVRCAKNAITDVIVIQSAEAKLDTGQGDIAG